MANREKGRKRRRQSTKIDKRAARSRKTRKAISRSRKRKRKPQARKISVARLERALRVFSETKDAAAAAKSLRVPKRRFLAAAKRYSAITKQKSGWKIAARIRRVVPIVSDGRHIAITVSSKTASLVGRYNSAVARFLETNRRDSLTEFVGRTVTDVNGKKYRLETDPNTLYRLSSAGEPFESIYRIVL